MTELDTSELEKILGQTHSQDFSEFTRTNSDSMLDMSNDFSQDMRSQLAFKGITQKELFVRADIPEKYGYKLISGEKTTRKRDVILRLTIAAELTLKQTQRVLHKYELPELYPKINRDALIMIGINESRNVTEINALLHENGFDELECPGQE